MKGIIKNVNLQYDWQKNLIGKKVIIENVTIEYNGGCNNRENGGITGIIPYESVKIIQESFNKSNYKFMKKRYILLKDTPELTKGAILEEKCNDGTQGFKSISPENVKFDDQTEVFYSRKSIMMQPKYFKELTPTLWEKIVNLLIKTK